MEQDPKGSLKCRDCQKRYVDMVSPTLGFCPKCGAKHEIKVTNNKDGVKE